MYIHIHTHVHDTVHPVLTAQVGQRRGIQANGLSSIATGLSSIATGLSSIATGPSNTHMYMTLYRHTRTYIQSSPESDKAGASELLVFDAVSVLLLTWKIAQPLVPLRRPDVCVCVFVYEREREGWRERERGREGEGERERRRTPLGSKTSLWSRRDSSSRLRISSFIFSHVSAMAYRIHTMVIHIQMCVCLCVHRQAKGLTQEGSLAFALHADTIRYIHVYVHAYVYMHVPASVRPRVTHWPLHSTPTHEQYLALRCFTRSSSS
jgi:hypothetical protein